MPGPEELAALRAKVDAHPARIWIGLDAYDFQRASLDSTGIGFDAASQEGVPRWAGGDKLQPAPLASPVSWDRVDRIAVLGGGAKRGAVAGALVIALAEVAVMASLSGGGSEDAFPGGVAILVGFGIVVGGLVGAAVGKAWMNTRTVWERPAAPAAP